MVFGVPKALLSPAAGYHRTVEFTFAEAIDVGIVHPAVLRAKPVRLVLWQLLKPHTLQVEPTVLTEQ